MHERLPVGGIAEIDANTIRVRPNAGFDVAAVAPAAILDRTWCEHDKCEGTQPLGMCEPVQRQLRIAWTPRQYVEPTALSVHATDLVVDQQLAARSQLVDAIRSQRDRQSADLVALRSFGKAHRERRPQLLQRELPQDLPDSALAFESR